MGQTEETVSLIKEIEELLTKLGARNKDADGKYIHGQGKITDVENKLPRDLAKKLRWIITIRNKLIHEGGFQVDDFNNYKNECNESIRELKKIISPPQTRKPIPRKTNENKEDINNTDNIKHNTSYNSTFSTNKNEHTSSMYGGIIVVSIIAITLWLSFSGMSDEEIKEAITNNNIELNGIKHKIEMAELNLNKLKNEQGILRTLIYDTKEVDLLEEDIIKLNDVKNSLKVKSKELKDSLVKLTEN